MDGPIMVGPTLILNISVNEGDIKVQSGQSKAFFLNVIMNRIYKVYHVLSRKPLVVVGVFRTLVVQLVHWRMRR